MALLHTAPAFVVEQLSAAGCVAAREEADELFAAAPDDETLAEWVRRRGRGEPLAWITGSMRFCGHTVRVGTGVYVPRHQTEALARRAAAQLPQGGAAVDLCTGSGGIAVHLKAEVPTATVVGVDIDRRAAACGRRNGVDVLVGDVDGPLRARAFDVVTAVAPYVPVGHLRLLPADVRRYEPRLALDGGSDGLDLVRRIVAAGARILRPGGWLFIEVGAEQDVALRPVLAMHGYGAVTAWSDDDGDLRGVSAQHRP